jgi:hypothetical protein
MENESSRVTLRDQLLALFEGMSDEELKRHVEEQEKMLPEYIGQYGEGNSIAVTTETTINVGKEELDRRARSQG